MRFAFEHLGKLAAVLGLVAFLMIAFGGGAALGAGLTLFALAGGLALTWALRRQGWVNEQIRRHGHDEGDTEGIRRRWAFQDWFREQGHR